MSRAAIKELKNFYVLETEYVGSEEAICRYFKRVAPDMVLMAQPNYIYSINSTAPNDTYWETENDTTLWSTWGKYKLGGIRKVIGIDDGVSGDAWDVTQGGGVVVAVLDTGTLLNHEDLAANIWTNPNEIPNNNIDDDGNGYIDDVHGWDFANNDNDPSDDNSHGTHVSGTIAAVRNNNAGVVGVAPDAKIMPIKGCTSTGSCSSSALAAGLIYAAENGADVINNSWGWPSSHVSDPVLENALRIQDQVGAVVVFAAANSNIDSKNISPQNVNTVITVSATSINSNNNTESKAGFSNFGHDVAVAAPGYAIYSTNRSGTSLKNYAHKTGTSMAAPHVAGAAALLLANNPNMTPAQVKQALIATTDPMISSVYAGEGRINIARALTATNILDVELERLDINRDGTHIAVDDVSIPIVGTAAGEGFASYTLLYGKTDVNSKKPSSYTVIQSSTDEIKNDILGYWDLSSAPTLAAGQYYYIRLEATNTDGLVFSTMEEVIIKAAENNESPFVNPNPDMEAVIDTPLTFTVVASDAESSSLGLGMDVMGSYFYGSLSAIGATFSDHGDGTGTFSWTPDSNDLGRKLMRVRVSDGSRFSYDFFKINVVEEAGGNNAPTLNYIDAITMNENQSKNITLYATDPDHEDDVTITTKNLPTFVTFNSETDILNINPIVGQRGNYTFTVTATDEGGLKDQQIVNLIVQAYNSAPVIDPLGLTVVTEGNTLTKNITATDADGDSFTITASGLPAFASFNGSTLSVTPISGDAGLHTVTFTVTDHELSSNLVHIIDVLPANIPSNLTGYWRMNEGSGELLHDISGNNTSFELVGFDQSKWVDGLSGYALRFDTSSTPNIYMADTAHLNTENLTISTWIKRSLSSSPNADGLYIGKNNQGGLDGRNNYSFFLAMDSSGTKASFSVAQGAATIVDPDALPLGEWVHVAATYDQSVAKLYVNGVEKSSKNVSTAIQYTVNGIRIGSYSGTRYRFDGDIDEIQMYGRALTAAEVGIIYNQQNPGTETPPPENTAPVLNAMANVSVDEGQTLNIAASAIDPDGDSLTYSFSNMPAGATTSDATMTFIPSFSQAGTYSVTASVTDGSLTDSETFTITVNNVNRAPVLNVIGNKSINEGTDLAFSISAADADGDTLSYSVTNLPSGANFTGGGNTNWTPGYSDAGIYSATYTVSDGNLSDSETITITVNNVNRAPILAAIGNKSVDEGETLNIPMSASDPDGDSVTIAVSALESFMSRIGDTLVMSPATGEFGNYSVTVTASDGSLSMSETIIISVGSVNLPPVMDLISDQVVDEGNALSFSINATDPNADALTYSASNMPAGATFTGKIFYWTPTYADSGNYSVTFSANDGELTTSKTMTITVNHINQAPVMSAVGNQSVNEGETLNFVLSASDFDEDSLTYSETNLPASATLVGNTVNWVTGYNDEGSYSVTLGVSDGSLTDSETITITVNNVNRAPVLNAVGDKSLLEGESLNISLSGIDPDGDSLSYNVTGMPSFMNLSSPTLNITPGLNDSGVYSLNIIVSDGILTDSETISVTVAETNLPPTAHDQSLSINEDGVLNVALTATDPDNNPLTYSIISQPAHGVLDMDNMPTAIYTPTTGYVGSDSFSFKAYDGQADSNIATVNIDVTANNHAPMLSPIDDKSVNENSLLAFTLTANDPDADTLTYSASDLPSGAQLSGAIFSWTPKYEQAGSYSVTFSVTDGEMSDSQTVTITVEDVNRAPVLDVIGDQAVDEGASISKTITATDPDGNQITITATGLSSFMSFDGTTFIVNPVAGDANPYSVSFTASDGNLTHSETITVTVQKPAMGLIGHWKLENNALDASGNGLNGKILNGKNAPQWSIGKVGMALELDGAITEISVANNPILEKMDAITLSAWVKPAGTDGMQTIFFKTWNMDFHSPFSVYSLMLNEQGYLHFEMRDVGKATSVNTLPANTWTFVTASYDNATNEIIMTQNGFEVARSTVAGDRAILSSKYNAGLIMGSATRNQFKFKGKLDELRIYDRALSRSEIINIVNTEGGAETNFPPALDAVDNQELVVGESVDIPLSASDPNGDAVSLSISDLSFASLNGSTLTIAPQEGDEGTHSLTITASDGELSSSMIISVTVIPAPEEGSGLLGYWKLEGNGMDFSGNNFHGKISGNQLWVAGHDGLALKFNGINNGIDIPNNSLLENLNAITLAAWVKPESGSVDPQAIFFDSQNMGFDSGQSIYSLMIVDGRLHFEMRDIGKVTSSVVLPVNQWTYVTATYDNDTDQLIIMQNGIEVARNSVKGNNVIGASRYNIGVALGIATRGKYSLKGVGDEFRIYNRALSASEITNIMNGQ